MDELRSITATEGKIIRLERDRDVARAEIGQLELKLATSEAKELSATLDWQGENHDLAKRAGSHPRPRERGTDDGRS